MMDGKMLFLKTNQRFVKDKLNQRTNGPVNAHLRSATYANKHV